MRQHRLRLASGLMTFFVGTSHAYQALRRGAVPERPRGSLKRRIAFVADRPATSLLHPIETIGLPSGARRLD